METQHEFLNSTILLTLFAGSCVVLLMYIIRMLKNPENVDDKVKNETKSVSKVERQKESATASAKSKKKNIDTRWTGRTDKKSYSHPWLLTTFKGHTDQVLDMDFSSHGKYLASCAEEPDPGGVDLSDESSSSASTSSSESNKENTHPTHHHHHHHHHHAADEQPQSSQGRLSRRQRKNRRRDDTVSPNSSPDTKKKPKTKRVELAKKPHTPTFYIPLRQFTKLNLDEAQVSALLRGYLLCPEQMMTLGYPVESDLYPGRAIIFKSPLTAPQNYNPYRTCKFDVNAREFVPSNTWDDNSVDSGQGSDSSSENSEQETLVKSSGPAVCNSIFNTGEQRECVRCGLGFFVACDGEYLTQEHCVYHWGKLQRVYNTTSRYNYQSLYSCCRNKQGSSGCMVGKLHVWNGVGVGFNGPFDSYVRTKPRKSPPQDGNYGIYALDCEMCYTVGGLELTKITVVAADGRLVYDSFVKPENDIVDYNTRFSGITAKDLNKKNVTKTLRDVQNDLMGFINADTVLVGHGLENDLRALKMMHGTIVDTAVTFPHYNGLPYRRSLKSLTSCFLKRDIQCNVAGHNSYEDAKACMELMLWRLRKDFRNILEHT